jgi:hypothetical protein
VTKIWALSTAKANRGASTAAKTSTTMLDRTMARSAAFFQAKNMVIAKHCPFAEIRQAKLAVPI